MVTMYNEKLNPLIWNDNNTLKDGVKESINRIIKQFVDDLDNIPIEIVDVRIVGSNASYNYTKFSDIDIHIVVNTDVLPFDSKSLKLIYDMARSRFNKNYNITIKTLPVEISIEDLGSIVTSNGVYSVMRDEWLKFPKKINAPDIDMTNTNAYKKLVKRINEILKNPNSKDIKDMINHLYIIRKNSIMIDGEFGRGNLLFKEIRNSGLLQKLKDELYNILSKELTFESYLENLDIQQAIKYFEEE